LLDTYLPDETLAAYVRQASVLVLPYRSATQSAVVQLAFGQGTPVITTHVGGLAEAVAHKQTGLVVPPEDVAALAAAINAYFAEEWGVVFRQRILEGNGRFSWQHLIAALQKL
jgi:glycosyltransferase involved in cell wall biosynthesis